MPDAEPNIVLQFNIVGSCNDSVSLSKLRAGWCAVLRIGDNTFEFQRPLCLQCDFGRQTSLRALFRSLAFVTSFVHNIVKLGARNDENPALDDERPLGAANMTVQIFTTEKHKSFRYLGRSLFNAHKDIDGQIFKTLKCLKQLDLAVEMIWESEEESYMKYATELAGLAHEESALAICLACEFKCDGDFSGMIEHIKYVHLQRDQVKEERRAALYTQK